MSVTKGRSASGDRPLVVLEVVHTDPRHVRRLARAVLTCAAKDEQSGRVSEPRMTSAERRAREKRPGRGRRPQAALHARRLLAAGLSPADPTALAMWRALADLDA